MISPPILTGNVTSQIEKLVFSESHNTPVSAMVDKLVTGEMEDLASGGTEEEAAYRIHREEVDAYDIHIEKEKAAMRKEQKRSTEGGWMRSSRVVTVV